MVYVVVEGVSDSLLRGVLVDTLFEDLAEAVPPTTEALCGLDDVSSEAVEGSAQIVYGWIVRHFSVEFSQHTDDRFSCLLEQGLVCSQSANDHLVDSVEDLALPIVVVDSHLGITLSVRLECLLLNGLKVGIANLLIVFNEVADFLCAVGFKVVTEHGDVHELSGLEVDWADNASIRDGLDLFLDVASLLLHSALGILKQINLLVALIDVLGDGQTKPVMVLGSLGHLHVELGDVLEE